MTLATRLRMVGGSGAGGGFAPPTAFAPVGARVTIASSAYNAFPGMTLLTGDDLMVTYRFGSAHNSAGGEVDYRVSTDLGITWPSGGTIIAGPASGSNDLRDPCILRLSTGRLVVAYDHRQPFNSSNIFAVTRYSDDGGAAWSSEYTLPTSYSGPLDSVVTSQPAELANGDVILPGFAENGAAIFAIYWRSTDDGATYGSPTVIASHATRDYQEPQLRVLDSGRWLVLMRSEWNHHTWRTYSDDAGVTWSTPDDVNAMTGRPDFVEHSPGQLFQIGRYATSADSPAYWTTSSDDGATWTTPVEVDAGETGLVMSAAPVAVNIGVVKVIYCIESSSSTCGLYFRTFAE